MSYLLLQTFNGISLGALLFLLSSGFSLIFGLMRIANLAHGSFFMIGAYLAYSLISRGMNFGLALVCSTGIVALLGIVFERFVLRRLSAQQLSQVLLTLGVTLISADFCVLVWGGDPLQLKPPDIFRGALFVFGAAFPLYRIAVIALAVVVFVLLSLLLNQTRLGAMIRAGVDDMMMARSLGVPVSNIFTFVFCLGAALAAIGGVVAAPITAVYPGIDADMLPLALLVVILGGLGSLAGAFVGSMLIGVVDTFGRALFPDFAYVVLFLPMIIMLALRPQGLFGRAGA